MDIHLFFFFFFKVKFAGKHLMILCIKHII